MRIATLRVLVILTFRPEFSPPWLGRPQVTLLNLNRLPLRQRAEMIACVTGGKATLPKEIADQIVDRTDGVPLFIEELTKSVVESGIVREAGDHYAVAGPVTSLAIPSSLHASLLARLDRRSTSKSSNSRVVGSLQCTSSKIISTGCRARCSGRGYPTKLAA